MRNRNSQEFTRFDCKINAIIASFVVLILSEVMEPLHANPFIKLMLTLSGASQPFSISHSAGIAKRAWITVGGISPGFFHSLIVQVLVHTIVNYDSGVEYYLGWIIIGHATSKYSRYPIPRAYKMNSN